MADIVLRLKYLMILAHNANEVPPLVNVKDENNKPTKEYTVNGNLCRQETHAFLKVLITNFKNQEATLWREVPDYMITASAEIIDEIQRTGELPRIDINARVLRSRSAYAHAHPRDFDDEGDDEEEEYVPGMDSNSEEDEFYVADTEDEDEIVDLETPEKVEKVKPVRQVKTTGAGRGKKAENIPPKVEKKQQGGRGRTKKMDSQSSSDVSEPVVEKPQRKRAPKGTAAKNTKAKKVEKSETSETASQIADTESPPQVDAE